MLVIDASMALAWVFERQQPEDGLRASRLLSTCGNQPWWVPGLWHLEVANALLVAERPGVIRSSASDLFRGVSGSCRSRPMPHLRRTEKRES